MFYIYIILSIYFIDDSSARFERLKKVYSDPMSEVYLMFYGSALQLFVTCNKFLQREDPVISVMLSQKSNFLKKLFGRFVTVAVIRAAGGDISNLDYNDSEKVGNFN